MLGFKFRMVLQVPHMVYETTHHGIAVITAEDDYINRRCMIRHADSATLGTILSVTDQHCLLKTSIQTEVKIF